jgi:glycine oxidase
MAQNCSTSDCLIIGGGVIGLSLAYELSGRGFSVHVLDQAEVGRGASWAGAGILPPSPTRGAVDPLDQLRALSHQLHSKWAVDLKNSTGIETGYKRCGGLYLARSAAESATLFAQQDLWIEHGIEAKPWTRELTCKAEPNLRELLESQIVRAIWYLPDECQIRNPWHLQALAAACRLRGVELQEHISIECIEPTSDDGVEAVAHGRSFRASVACICSGAWSRLLMDHMHIPTGIMPIRGQMVLYKTEKTLLQHVVNEGHRYLVARDDGRLLAGSCEEEVGYDVATTDSMIRQLRGWAESILPELRHAKIEKTWAGLRPGTFDGLPYLGQVPNLKHLYVASGHYRAGLHLSCATAEVMADLMQGRKPAIDLSAFRIGRG